MEIIPLVPQVTEPRPRVTSEFILASTLRNLLFLPDGNVGIGTATPAWKLHVLGNDGVAKIESTSTNSWLQLKGSTTYSWQIGATSSGLQLYSDATGATQAWFKDNGYVDMAGASQVRLTLGSQGTAGANDSNWIRGTGTSLGFNAGGGSFHWEVSGAQKMSLSSTGALVIQDALTINGNITNSADSAYFYLNNAGTGNSGVYIAGFSGDTMRCHVPASKYFEWEVGGTQKLKLDSAGLLTVAGGLTVGGNAVVTGNLTVNGTTTTIDTTNLLIEDPLLLLARTQSGTPTLDSGLIIERGSSTNVGMIWDESADQFAFINTTDTATTAGQRYDSKLRKSSRLDP